MLISYFAFADQNNESEACKEKQKFNLESHQEEFCWSDQVEGWISKTCVDEKNNSCGALTLIDKIKQNQFKLKAVELQNGKNPGSVACSKFGGEIEYAKLEDSGSQITFCKTHDKTYINSNSISNAMK